MNVSSYFSGISQEIGGIPPSSLPALLWDIYIRFLWSYEPNSWVARIASMCRVLAILVSLPIVVLALLDIASYGIARTLGVIDDVKASTTDTSNLHPPSIRVSPSSTPSSTFSDSGQDDSISFPHNKYPANASLSLLGASQPKAFYASDEGTNFKLSGVGLFSPVASRPASPVLGRKAVDGGDREATSRLRHWAGKGEEM
ncbi:hypothetical protein H0H93_014784 [Arthromyces matolae]|nr:hypothetical protein H0H93_014784 [Arthromyces matolae]